MKFKKLSKILLLSSILTLGIGCARTEKVNVEEKYKVGLVLSVGGVNDESFNQSAWEGALRAEEEYENVEVTYLESNGEADYIPNIETLVDMNMDLIVGVGFQVSDSVKEAAEAYPNQTFAMIDSTYDNVEEIPSNVRPILFNEEQAGYLTGLIAGKMTKTNTVSWIGGFDIPSCTPFYTGYEKGAKEANPNVKVLRQYINSFTDAAKGKVSAKQMIKEGSDIIFMATGGGNMGIIEAIKEAGGNVKGIGVDMPMSYLAKDYIVTSALKNVGEGLKLTIKDYIDGNFNGGNEVKYDLTNGGVGYEITDHLSEDLIKYVDNKINK